MTEEQNKYLKLARRAREEDNTEDAKKFYDMVRTDDPDNAEARYFYAYYKMMEGKKIEVYGHYVDLLNVILPVVKSIAKSESDNEEKAKLLKDIFENFKDLPLMVNKSLNDLNRTFQNSGYASKIRDAGVRSIKMFYDFGDLVESEFSGILFKNLAVEAWKAGVYRQQQWYGMGVDKTLPETYTAKIQKVDASYTMPAKAGCISFAK